MVCRGFSLNTKTPAVILRGHLNADRYHNEILRPVCIPHLRNNRGMRFMQDGTPCHSAHITMALFQANKVNVLPWPSRSPDLNHIEHIWDVIDREVIEMSDTITPICRRRMEPNCTAHMSGERGFHAHSLPGPYSSQWRSYKVLINELQDSIEF